MNSIFFEKQEGSLCAQHALNALLQGAFFSAVDLADIARRIDAQEIEVLATAGHDSVDYLRAMQADSHNMDDSGFFSVQVITEALKIWALELIPYASTRPEAREARQDPSVYGRAYICNHREHWFTIRKLGFQWFNLNSLLAGPQLISDTYLHLFLAQLQNEGYSIFLIRGILPQCQADDVLSISPVDPTLTTYSTVATEQRVPYVMENSLANQDPELAQALALSLQQAESNDKDVETAISISKESLDSDDKTLKQIVKESLSEQELADMEAAIKLSMTDTDEKQEQDSKDDPPSAKNPNADVKPKTEPQTSGGAPSGVRIGAQPAPEQLRQQREAFLNKLDTQTDEK